MGTDRDQRKQDAQERLQERFLEKVLGGGGPGGETAQTDPDLLSVMREIRDNTGRIARALEARDTP